jgi:hypothetical protein
VRLQEVEREFLAASQNALREQGLERELLAARTEIAANDYPRLKAERDFCIPIRWLNSRPTIRC